jgi:hypothetical protein
MITSKQILNALTSFKLQIDSPIAKIVIKDFKVVESNQPIKYLSKGFARHNYIIVRDCEKYYVCDHKVLLNNFLNNH